ncbi:MAG: hypothetical protein LLG44_11495 [Chloroflexi bacterium]|nr:hypothetical protein [Chloroflexota bacterium]
MAKSFTQNIPLVEQGWVISPSRETPWTNANGVCHDSMIPLGRDSQGRLWALFGHTRAGGVTLWSGASIDDLHKIGHVRFNFELGEAGFAFNGISYPEGVRSRGGLWAMGLWIDTSDDTFYCYIHNETGWGAGATSYTAHGYQEGEPDFRHLGLMISHDYGRSWDFGGWIISSPEPCWTTAFQVEGMSGGQDPDKFCLGAGDMTLFVNDQDKHLYIYFTKSCAGVGTNIYAARAPMSSNGLPGSWRKYYNGSFSEPGNLGQESPVCLDACEPCVVYSTYLNQYLLSSYNGKLWRSGQGACQIAFSQDPVHFSYPIPLAPARQDLSYPYWTMCNSNTTGNLTVVAQTFRLIFEGNGTDLHQVDVTIPEPDSTTNLRRRDVK